MTATLKIAWIQDMDPMVNGGGAELNDRAMILYGLKQWHDIKIIVPSYNISDLEHDYDLAIISNSTTFGTPYYDELERRKVPYVLFVHDAGPQLCRYRLLFPAEPRCKDVCYLRDRWRGYLQRSRLIIWLSSLHRRAWLYGYPDLKNHPYALVPSAINSFQFYDLHYERHGALAVNAGALYKGAENVAKWAAMHPEIKLTLVGGNPEGFIFPENVEIQGLISYAKMNELYNRHEYFVHLPANVGPFDRTCVEAYLAGCKLVVNKLVGATYWPQFKKGRTAVSDMCLNAPDRFWKAVIKAVNQ